MGNKKSIIIENYFQEIKKQFLCKKTNEILGTRYKISEGKGEGNILRLHIDNNIEIGIFDISSKYKYYFNNLNEADLLIVSYCFQGSKKIDYDRKYKVKKGDILYFRPSKKISCNFTNYKAICFLVDLNSIKNNLAEYEGKKSILEWSSSIDSICKQNKIIIEVAPDVVNVLMGEIKDIKINDFVDYIKIKGLILNYFIFLLRLRVNKCCLLNKNKDEIGYVWEAEKIIMENLGNELLIQDLADKLNISTYKLQKSFKKFKGTTVYDFIRKTKIDESKIFLEETELPIICIAHNLGYENPSKFSSAFKDIVGLTPTEYRKKFKK